MRIKKEKSFAMVVDFQERLMPVIDGQQQVLENAARFLKGLNLLQVPLVLTEQYPKGIGQTVEIIKNEVPVPALEKITFSCYLEPAIRKAVDAYKAQGRSQVILFGVEAHICVLQTLIDLRADGFEVFLVSDCISSRRKPDKEAALLRAMSEGAAVTTSEAMLFELTERAGSDLFKQISKLVK